jgi:signal transduction histidine kinase
VSVKGTTEAAHISEDSERLAGEQAALRRVATLVAHGAAPDEVFAAVALEVGKIIPGADIALLSRYGPPSVSEIVGVWGHAPRHLLVGLRVPLGGRNIHTLVFETQRLARLDDLAVAQDSSVATVIAREVGARSAVGAPIHVDGQLWGVILLASSGPHVLPPDTERRLAAFTELVATAVANAQAREELRALLDEQAALRRVATLVARGASQERVFAAVAHEVSELFTAEATSVVRYSAGGATAVGSWNSLGLGDRTGDWKPLGGHNVTTLVAELNRPVRIDAYETDDPSSATLAAKSIGIKSAAAAPITIEGRLWGALEVAISREHRLPIRTEERLAAFADLTATAIANATSRAELAASRARIVTTADETRRRMERDLHDGAQQRLVSLGLQLRAVQATVPPDLVELSDELASISTGLISAVDELREFARGIHPAGLLSGGLAAALKSLARRSSMTVELQVQLKERLPRQSELGAYYVVSEALTNAAKHAGAATVVVRAEDDGDLLRLSVRDDGVGGARFDGGSGLLGIKDRAEALGGRLFLNSPPGSGTELTVEMPLSAPV